MLVARGPVDRRTRTTPSGTVVVDHTQRRRSRFRTVTTDGRDVGVVVENAPVLSAGDCLETDGGEVFVVELESVEALVVDLPSGAPPTAMVVAGHAIGNRHWDLVAQDERLYVPGGGETAHRRDALRDLFSEAATVAVESVEPTLFDESYTSAHGDADHSHDHEHAHGDAEHSHDTSVVTRTDLRRQRENRREE